MGEEAEKAVETFPETVEPSPQAVMLAQAERAEAKAVEAKSEAFELFLVRATAASAVLTFAGLNRPRHPAPPLRG